MVHQVSHEIGVGGEVGSTFTNTTFAEMSLNTWQFSDPTFTERRDGVEQSRRVLRHDVRLAVEKSEELVLKSSHMESTKYLTRDVNTVEHLLGTGLWSSSRASRSV